MGEGGIKRVLVVGKGGYIGESFAAYAGKQMYVNVVDSHEGWKTISFSGYDAVLFAAGIAHRKQTVENKKLYFDVNRDLALAVADKAKSDGARQFIYLSSMAVYGNVDKGEISRNTIPTPRHNDYYGQSKLEAEQGFLHKFECEDFKIAIVRPPMVYGAGCPGKFSQLMKLAKFLPIVPDAKNKRSMIYIDNLCEILCTTINECQNGVLCPQNKEYVNTAEMISLIRQALGMNTFILPRLPWLFKIAEIFPVIGEAVKNAFGSLYYAPCIYNIPANNAVSFEDSIRESITSVRTGGAGHNKE